LNDLALELLDKFKWGHTFYELNQELLNDYSKLESEDEINPLLQEYNIFQ
jgi:pre-rRNA-processing protein TSR3